MTGKQKSNPDQNQISTLWILGRYFLFSVGGLLLVVFFFWLNRTGIFEAWESLATVPDNTIKILDGSPWSATIQTSDNRTLICSFDEVDCWKPGVSTGISKISECDYRSIAFSPFFFRRRSIKYCTSVKNNYYGEMDFTGIFLVDDQNRLWKWDKTAGWEFMLWLLAVPVFGWLGLLYASISTISKKDQINKRAGNHLIKFSILQKILLSIPFVILISLILAQIFFYVSSIRDSISDQQRSNEYQQVLVQEKTREAKKWQIVLTPNPGSLKYDFVKFGCEAKWSTQWGPISCGKVGDEQPKAVWIDFFELSEPNDYSGNSFILTTEPFPYIRSQFPVILIGEGDMFKSSILCVKESAACNMIFDVSIQVEDGLSTTLGQWNPDTRIDPIDINLDLSAYAGKKVRLYLNIDPIDSKTPMARKAVWITPRIQYGDD